MIIAVDTRQGYNRFRSSRGYCGSVMRALPMEACTTQPATERPRLLVLGDVDMEGGGPRFSSLVAKPRRLALLAYLAAASPRRFHSRDELITLFWPEHDEAHGRAALRQAIHVLRRALGDDIITTRGAALRIDDERLSCDLASFHRLYERGETAAALELYRGELLPGFHISAAPAFERWLDAERGRLRYRVAQAAWSLASVAERDGETASAAGWAEAAVQFVPDDEVALRRLLSTYDRLGDRVRAVRTYQEFSVRIAREYAVQPSPETQELIRVIRMRMCCRADSSLAVSAEMAG